MITIYHNPRCSNSRRTLSLLQERGLNPTVIEYLHTPPDLPTLQKLLQQTGLSARDLVRNKEALYDSLGLAQVSDDALLQAMVDHPVLINRPIVVTDKGARLCRPPETVLDIL